MKTGTPSRSFYLFQETGILSLILPELSLCAGVSQKGNREYDVFEHLLQSCDAAPAHSSILRFAALFHDIGKPKVKTKDSLGIPSFHHHEFESEKIASPIMERYRFPKNDSKKILQLIRHHMFHYTDDWTDAAVRRFIRRIGIENLQDQYLLREADIRGMSKKHKESDFRGLRKLQKRVRPW